MIDKLRVQNFKCLRDVEIDFTPLTVLIGPNDSGKTSILEAMELLGRTTVTTIARAFAPHDFSHYRWLSDDSEPIRWSVAGSLGTVPFRYILAEPFLAPTSEELLIGGGIDVGTFRVDGQTKLASEPRLAHMRRALRSHPRLCLEPRLLRNSSVPRPGSMLSATGDNLAAVMDDILTGPDPRSRTSIDEALHDTISTIQNVYTRASAHGEKSIAFVLSKLGKTVSSDLVSDGVMLVTAFLALAYGETEDTLLIEEPENGLHPAILSTVIDLLRKIAKGEIGNRPRQVILTTHSPILLTFAEPDEVRIVQRDPETGTFVRTLGDNPDLQKLLKDFGLGELWWSLGEKGLTAKEKP